MLELKLGGGIGRNGSCGAFVGVGVAVRDLLKLIAELAVRAYKLDLNVGCEGLFLLSLGNVFDGLADLDVALVLVDEPALGEVGFVALLVVAVIRREGGLSSGDCLFDLLYEGNGFLIVEYVCLVRVGFLSGKGERRNAGSVKIVVGEVDGCAFGTLGCLDILNIYRAEVYNAVLVVLGGLVCDGIAVGDLELKIVALEGAVFELLCELNGEACCAGRLTLVGNLDFSGVVAYGYGLIGRLVGGSHAVSVVLVKAYLCAVGKLADSRGEVVALVKLYELGIILAALVAFGILIGEVDPEGLGAGRGDIRVVGIENLLGDCNGALLPCVGKDGLCRGVVGDSRRVGVHTAGSLNGSSCYGNGSCELGIVLPDQREVCVSLGDLVGLGYGGSVLEVVGLDNNSVVV